MKKILSLIVGCIVISVGAFSQTVSVPNQAFPFFFQQSFVGETGNLATTTLFTAVREETCHISAYTENISLDANGVGAYLGYTDNYSVRSANISNINGTYTFSLPPEIYIIHVKSGTDVTINIQENGPNQSQEYSLYVTAICQ